MKSRQQRLAEYERISKLLPEAKATLMSYPGVRDVAVGLKEIGARPTETIAFRVYVDEKKIPRNVPAGGMIPAEVLGVPTDVVIEPTPQLIEDTDKYRPMQGGIQIGNDSSSSLGTLGCLAQLTADGSIVMLSNHHVMMSGGAAVGEKIGQPEIACCCCCKTNIVGEVLNAVDNALVDCAIARITGQPGFTNEIQDIGFVFGSAPLNGAGSTVAPGDTVMKRGRTTGLTTGTVLTPLKAIGGKTNQIEITPDAAFPKFAYKGDSGSAVVNDENVVVGLLYAIDSATETLGYANLITNVTAAMGITILNTGTAGTVPLGAAPSSEELAGIGVNNAPLRDVAKVLERFDEGRRVLDLFNRHGREINHLLETNREVKVAWHRFQGPVFTAHIIQSARERDHVIPREIEGVTPANLLIRMAVVLQDHGTPDLATAVDENTIPLLDLFATAGSVHDLIERFAPDSEWHVEGNTKPAALV